MIELVSVKNNMLATQFKMRQDAECFVRFVLTLQDSKEEIVV